MAADSQLTPHDGAVSPIKGELPKDALLLFRLGDFYEMFFEDAQVGAQLCNLALTKRNGVPHVRPAIPRRRGYIARLLKAGRKVAIATRWRNPPRPARQTEVAANTLARNAFRRAHACRRAEQLLAAVCASGRTSALRW